MWYYAVFAGVVLILSTAVAQEDVLRPRGAPVFEAVPEHGLPVMVGIEGGLNWNFASTSLQYLSPTPPTNTPDQQFTSGSGFSPFAAVAVDLGLTPKLGLQLRLGYDAKTIGHSGTAEADCYDPLGAYLETTPVSVEWTFTMSALTAGAGLRYELTPQLWLTAGVTALFLQSNKQTATLTSQSDQCGFLNPGDGQLYRTLQTTTEFNSPPMKKTRVGAEVGLGYKIALARSLWLVPQLQFQLLSTFRDEINGRDEWKPSSSGVSDYVSKSPSQHSLRLLVGLWFGL